MTSPLRPCLLALALATAPLARAADGRLVLGARAGAAAASGAISATSDIDRVVEWAFPLQLELGYRLAPSVAIAVYGRYAPATLDAAVEGACGVGGQSCDVHGLGAGLALEIRFSEQRRGAWLGAFGGYERLVYERVNAVGLVTSRYEGWELGLQGGLDLEVSTVTVGPFAAASFGQFTSADQSGGGVSLSGAIGDRKLHGWIQAGVRAALSFW